MSQIDVPAWLTPSFARSASAVGAAAEREHIERVCAEFIKLWSTPNRHFHDIRHLCDVLTRIDMLSSEAHNVDAVRLAAWAHGCVFNSSDQQAYVHQGGEDRAESARVSAELFEKIGIPSEVVQQISKLILDMRKHPLPTLESRVVVGQDLDLLVLVDAHLGFLASQPQKYRDYVDGMRAEYSHLPLEDFANARLAVVNSLLDRKRLFSTPLATDWEAPARQNLELEKARLEAELSDLHAGYLAPPHTLPQPEISGSQELPNRQVPIHHLAPSQADYSGSTLEAAGDHLDPRKSGKVLRLEDAKQARRDAITQTVREKAKGDNDDGK